MIDLSILENLMNKTRKDRHYWQYELAWQLKLAAPELIRLAKIGQQAEENKK